MILTPRPPTAALLVTPGGIPIPPREIVSRLSAISPRLSIEWIAGAHVPYWGLKVRWPDGDPRWERVRTGEISPASAFDLEQMFPRDCSVSDMAAFVEQRWGDRARSTDPARDAERIVEAAKRSHAEHRESAVDRVVHDSTEKSATESAHARRVRSGDERAHPMVRGGLTP